MLGRGGAGIICNAGVLLTGLLLAAGMSGCEYTDAGDPKLAAAPSRSSPPRAALPTKDQATAALEANNLASAKQMLGAAAGTVLLEDSGTVGGAASGVRKGARVAAAGSYTVTASCVGAPNVRLFISQDPRTGLAPQDQTFDCSGTYSQVVQLQPGPVNVEVQVNRVNSGTPTGAGEVAAVRVTAND